MILQTFDEQMPDIVRREYGLHPALAGPFRKENGSAGIHVSASGRQSRTAALEKQNFAYNPDNRR